MYCWGNMRNGELGLGGLEEETITFPRASTFKFSENITEVGCGDNHTILVLKDGKVYSFGSNDYGQLGHEKPRTRPEKVDGLDAQTITRVACGSHHTLALNEWGEIFAWGSNASGQLGLNLQDSVNLPPKMVKFLATKQVVQVACGRSHSLALTNIGELYSWGANNNGQLGLGSAGAPERKPCPIKTLQGVPISHIACGADFSFAVSCSGAVFAWGKNSSGQLGLGDTIDRPHPVQLKSLRFQRVTYVSCGMDHTVVLTKDGGVFTFGGGTYGQLGHGSKANQMLPRKVLELMGSTVTQVASGRYHTLAFVPARGRIYAFGMGTSGQLGGSTTTNTNSPQLVQGPWVTAGSTPNGTSPSDSMEVDDHPSESLAVCQRLIVRKIFAGGDQSFTLVSPDVDGVESCDYRERPASTQMLTIQPEEVRKLRLLGPEETVDLDLLRYVETVFSHVACYNASFLRRDGSHFGCSAKNHGLDLELCAETFAQISRIENTTVCELLRRCIFTDLLASLPVLPPDLEVLRVHLILPLYHEFLNVKHFEELHSPFAGMICAMSKDIPKLYECWLASTSTDYFIRLINVYKQAVLHILNLPPNLDSATTLRLGGMLKACLEFLKIVNSVNRSTSVPKVGHEQFYIPELAEQVDLKKDYVKWVFESPKEFRLCNYSFLFDAKAKTLLLEADQALQMQHAMAVEPRPFLYGLLVPPIQQYLFLEVRRSHIVVDTISKIPSDMVELKKPLKVKFKDEEAEDAGGVRKEFFMLLLKEILNPNYGMFTYYEESRAIWFSEISCYQEISESLQMYELIGKLCGLAIYNFTIINLPFPLVLYKKLLGETVLLDDLACLMPTLLRSFHSLLEYEGDDLEDVFCLNFIVSREVFGAVKTDELKPGGANIPVTQSNKQEYVDLYVDFLLNKSVEQQFSAFSAGFLKVCGGRVLALFQAHELMDLVTGTENYDWYTLQETCEYKNGFSADHSTIKLFWEVFHDLDHEQKKKFLLFLTGSDRIPILGMKAVKMIIQRVGSSDSHLPVAHTCFNVLDLPVYHTKEKLRYKLLQAIQQTQGFALA